VLSATFVLAIGYLALGQFHTLPWWVGMILAVVDHGGLSFWFLVLLVLLPLAMTMALIWKTKEVILDSLFSGHQ
jgi:hypothetical protein